jgi:carboxymethylenebutenolidase
MKQEIIDLYDDYTHSRLDRRTFLLRLAQVAGSVAAAEALLPLLASNTAQAAIVAADDARVVVSRMAYPGAKGELKGYLARPAEAKGKLPALVVIHENRGLNAHIEDVARRFALEGFLALAPDLLSPLGGTPANEDEARETIGKLDKVEVTANLQSTLAFLEKHESSNGKVGAVGFCWGGLRVGELAIHAGGDLDAGVVYYGRQPEAEGVPKISAPLLLHYAGLDERVNEGIAAFEAALKAAGKKYTLHLYEGANHAFNNDTSEARYSKVAADLAWSRTVEFFKLHLG